VESCYLATLLHAALPLPLARVKNRVIGLCSSPLIVVCSRRECVQAAAGHRMQQHTSAAGIVGKSSSRQGVASV
jgi:hypothetical protein